jgi:hypothetical protein
MKRLLLIVAPFLLVACSAHRSTAPSIAMGMIGPRQDSDSSFAGKPGDLQDSSFAGKPTQTDPNTMTPQGTGYNQAPGEMRPQMAGSDIHYHVHYHGNSTGSQGGASGAGPLPGYAPAQFGARVNNGNLGRDNNGQMQAPLGTGGGGAGSYGPNYEGNTTGGLRQGYGSYRGEWNGFGFGGGGIYNGYTD